MTYKIKLQKPDGETEIRDVGFEPIQEGELPTALDLLLQVQERELPELAFRYGCRNKMCGVCTINVNGKPRLACRQKLKEGDELSALSTLPVIRDLVVRRDQINRQLQGRIPRTSETRSDNGGPVTSEEYDSLNRCVECYFCLDGCPLHEQNNDEDHQTGLKHGNPYAFLKVWQAVVDPLAKEEDRATALDVARDLGVKTCADCDGCKCGIGINLMKDVIRPLVAVAV